MLLCVKCNKIRNYSFIFENANFFLNMIFGHRQKSVSNNDFGHT